MAEEARNVRRPAASRMGALRTHNEENLGLQFDCPDDWKVSELTEMNKVMIESPVNANGLQALVIIHSAGASNGSSVEQAASQLIAALRETEEDFTFVDQRIGFHEHWPGSAMFEYTRNYYGIAVRDWRLLLSRGTRVGLDVSASCPSDLADRYKRELDVILRSIRPLEAAKTKTRATRPAH